MTDYYQNQPPGTKFCPNCGNQLDIRAEICPKCGVRVQAPPPPPPVVMVEKKSGGLAAVLSFIIPGLGQIYNGEIGKGIAILIAAVILAVFFFLLITLLVLVILWIWNIYDAYKGANEFNQRAMGPATYQQYPPQ